MTKTSKTEQQSLHAAARTALEKGWYIFATPYKSKIPYAGTKGSKDALNDTRALSRWENGAPSNPCIRLDKSNLVVLDIDHGLTSLEHAEAWAAANNLPTTYIVSSGRESGGFHFYFRGERTLPDVVRNPRARRVGFEHAGVSGDLKCHGHVVAEGGLHKSGAMYLGNGKNVAPLPDWIRDYEDPVAKTARERQSNLAMKRSWGQVDGEDNSEVLKQAGERHDFLLREAGTLRWQGLEEESIYLGLKDICRRFCDDAENYPDSDLRRLAHDIGAKPCDRRLRRPGFVNAPPPTSRMLVAGRLRQEFPLGCLVSIETILKRIDTEYPNLPKMTLRRAMQDVGFVTATRDPADRRKFLWTRKGVRPTTKPTENLPQQTTNSFIQHTAGGMKRFINTRRRRNEDHEMH